MDEPPFEHRLLIATARLVIRMGHELAASMDARDANRFKDQYVRPVRELVEEYDNAVAAQRGVDTASTRLITEAMLLRLEQVSNGVAGEAGADRAVDGADNAGPRRTL